MIEEANHEIAAAVREAAERRAEAERLDRVVRAIDDLLFELEDLNLQAVDRVPAPLRERSGAVLATVPRDRLGDEDPLRVRYRVVPMMDVLFRAQEILFRLKDPMRVLYGDEEDES